MNEISDSSQRPPPNLPDDDDDDDNNDCIKMEEFSSESGSSNDGRNSVDSNSDAGHPKAQVSPDVIQLPRMSVSMPVVSPRKNTDSASRNLRMRTPSVNTVPEMNTEEKSSIIKKNLTVMFSGIYCVFLVVVGGVIYINNQGPDAKFISEIFSTCNVFIGMSWLLFFHADLYRYKQKVIKRLEENAEQIDTVSTYTIDFGSDWEGIIQNPPYRFLTGRHSGSFYLKTGLAAFCFGHVINEGLQLGQEILNFSQLERGVLKCGNVSSLVIHSIRPIYSFYQLFIVFKYSNIVISKYKEVARFALMHIIGTCLCFWLETIVQDALEDYHLMKIASENSVSEITASNATGAPIEAKNISSCATNTILSVNNLQAIPYLYPFTIEFNLLLAGVWFIVWHNVGKENQKSNPHHFQHKISKEHGIEEVIYQSNLVISADCHASNKGLFLGLFFLVTVIISIIVFFVAMTSDGYVRLGISIHTAQEVAITTAALIGVIVAYRQLSKLDFNKHPITFLDDVLLFVPLPFHFINAILSVVAEMHVGRMKRIALSVLNVIQVILQTPFICDGLRRCSNSHTLKYKKPGREIVTFLIVCNLTKWIINTFEAKSIEPYYAQQAYFGEFLWMFMSHTTLPMMLFYRFHSSVCLADIWKSAYVKGE